MTITKNIFKLLQFFSLNCLEEVNFLIYNNKFFRILKNKNFFKKNMFVQISIIIYFIINIETSVAR